MADQEPDIHNFSTSSSHRLPTISGTQALQNELNRARGISTGLTTLDQLIGGNPHPSPNGGIRRGHVTEVYGPPGVGKTTFGMQVAIDAIRDLDSSSKAVYISTGTPLVHDRLHAIIRGHEVAADDELPSSPPQPRVEETDVMSRLVYLETQSLPRLLTLLMHPTSIFPPPSTSAIIVDDLSNLILGSFSKPSRNNTTTNNILHDRLAQKATSRRFQVIENLASALSRLAASRHLAIVILNNATTSLRTGQKALLKPALSGQAWDAVVNTRIALYRDFGPSEQRNKLTSREKRGYRLAAVVRLGGRDVYREAVPFVIEDGGLLQISSDHQEGEAGTGLEAVAGQPPSMTHPDERTLPVQIPSSQREIFQSASQHPTVEEQRATKRKAIEIADSDGEDDADAENGIEPGGNEPDLPTLGFPDPHDTAERDDDEVLFETHKDHLPDNKAGLNVISTTVS